jgi:hypothetical protein
MSLKALKSRLSSPKNGPKLRIISFSGFILPPCQERRAFPVRLIIPRRARKSSEPQIVIFIEVNKNNLGASGASTNRALRGFRHGNKKIPRFAWNFFIAATAYGTARSSGTCRSSAPLQSLAHEPPRPYGASRFRVSTAMPRGARRVVEQVYYQLRRIFLLLPWFLLVLRFLFGGTVLSGFVPIGNLDGAQAV